MQISTSPVIPGLTLESALRTLITCTATVPNLATLVTMLEAIKSKVQSSVGQEQTLRQPSVPRGFDKREFDKLKLVFN